VRVFRTGKISYMVKRRFGTKYPVRLAFDQVGAITLKEAREKARAWIELGQQGKHPLEEEKARRAAERAKQGVPFRTVAEDFIARQVVGQRRGANDGREIRN
jgi:Arm DNA-binding domain